ncbi:MAG: glycoside hydrolase family 43 protein [Armatimonadetes bacterium]|nr:glycoside hydrolase family 43 protein [Armatimonadota bacterium]
MTPSQATAWMLAYFRQIYRDRVEITPEGVKIVPLTDEKLCVEALHLAYSRDGRRWTALNGNRPVRPETKEWRVRDPVLARGPDGRFHLVATGGESRRGMLYSTSPDLIDWEPPRTLPVMDSDPEARNVWAPEWVWDEAQGNYFLFWSSSHGRHGWDDSRIWCARTPDFRTFTPPRLLFDPGFTVIDASLVRHEGTWFMFFKDERFGCVHGEHRFIKVATAPQLDGPYEIQGGPVTPSITEGPAVFRPDESGPWFLLYDHCMDNHYGLSVSEDLLRWEESGEAEFPPNARHGSVFPVAEGELDALLERFG